MKTTYELLLNGIIKCHKYLFYSCPFFSLIFHIGTISICLHFFSVPASMWKRVDSQHNRVTLQHYTIHHSSLEIKLKQMFQSTSVFLVLVFQILKNGLKCFLQMFQGCDTLIFWRKTHSWKDCGTLHLFVQGFSHIRAFLQTS